MVQESGFKIAPETKRTVSNDDELVLYLSKNYRVAKVILYKYHLEVVTLD